MRSSNLDSTLSRGLKLEVLRELINIQIFSDWTEKRATIAGGKPRKDVMWKAVPVGSSSSSSSD
jgi:hypothetical protein